MVNKTILSTEPPKNKQKPDAYARRKRRTMPFGIDDAINELQFALNDDGRPIARCVRWVFVHAYRAFSSAISTTLRLPWKTGLDAERAKYPEIGHEPFNLPPDELMREWRR